jgi:hypothetical protein
LWEQLVPEVKGKVFVDAAEASNEVILEGSDSAFSGIAAVDPRWYQLEVNLLFVH